MRYLRYLYVPMACCAAGLAIVLGVQGLTAAWITLVLLLLEISLSFDNAVVNARVLDQLTPGQQRFFLTWGLVIPVFGVRFAGPLLMVALAHHTGIVYAENGPTLMFQLGQLIFGNGVLLAVLQLATVFGFVAWQSGYSRGAEGQADRVGLRYVYEAGYNGGTGPRLWHRFAEKYGNDNAVVNFFFGSHSRSLTRAAHLDAEIALNYSGRR